MAKKRRPGRSPSNQVTEQGTVLDRQSAKMVGSVVGTLESLAYKATKAVTAGSRKKYLLGALAALVVAGKAAQILQARLTKSSKISGSRKKRV
jgi:hypothetical protein